jgi:hypothetical protein
MADSHIKSLSSGMYRFYTIVTNHNGPLEAVDCDIHSVRYDMVLEVARGHPNWTSSGHLRRCSMADSHIKSLSSGMYRFYTIDTNHNGPLEAVDCDIHSVRYDMVLRVARGPPKLGLIRSPTTL